MTFENHEKTHDNHKQLVGFIVNYFQMNTDYLLEEQVHSLNEIARELSKIGIENQIIHQELLKGTGQLIIDIALNEKEPNFVFCVFDHDNDLFKFYDFKNNVNYYSNSKALGEVSRNRKSILLLPQN